LGQVAAVSAAAATAVVLVVTAALLWVAIRLTRSRHVGALVLTVLILAFYSYGAARDLAVRLTNDPPVSPWLSALFDPFTSHSVLTLVMLGLCALLIFQIVRRLAAGSERLTGACNFAAVTLATFLLVRLGVVGWQQHNLSVNPALAGITAGKQVSVLGYNPDIYYVIVDGYARADVLREYYDFDNSEFVAGLEKRGFAVNDSSRANYYWTFLSLASSLNYDYLQDIAAPLFADPETTTLRNGYEHVARLAQDNRAAQFLRARGYRYVHIQSSTPPTVRNPYADEQVACKGSLFDDEYFRTLAEITWLRVGGSLASADLAECHKLRLRSLGDQARQPGPKFVFAHFLPPHHPYLFDRHGNVLKHVTVSNQFDFQAQLWEDKHGYLEQVLYTNRTVLEVVDRILAESERPPIIIVQSDHGPNLLGGVPRDKAIALRFANFAAYFLPGAPPGTLPRDCAPVNQFRYLFNQYFDARLPILPDRNFFSTYGTPLRMQEVAAISPTGNES
ncbi:MAG TPA: hypothetical protein VFO82_08550, partial [Steroidobacteraceae bacterium]|nr:hypothetical protein [Steroidobacteraceae bacterium]